MKHLLCLLGLTLSTLAFPVAFARQEVLVGQVVYIVDGDTLDVRDEAGQVHRLRLSCLDAPERAQPFSRKSKEMLSALSKDLQVSVDFYKRDRYHRLIGELREVDVCLKMIEAGLAWHNAPYAKELKPGRASELQAAETSARNNKLGLWSEGSPLEPWTFRHQQREKL
jgi:micrococcal nuclease